VSTVGRPGWRRLNRLFEGFNRRGVEAVIEVCDPEVEWSPALAAGDGDATYRGHEGVRRYFAELAARWSAARAPSSIA
jgi:ketosteroid isomerase-like protein